MLSCFATGWQTARRIEDKLSSMQMEAKAVQILFDTSSLQGNRIFGKLIYLFFWIGGCHLFFCGFCIFWQPNVISGHSQKLCQHGWLSLTAPWAVDKALSIRPQGARSANLLMTTFLQSQTTGALLSTWQLPLCQWVTWLTNRWIRLQKIILLQVIPTLTYYSDIRVSHINWW